MIAIKVIAGTIGYIIISIITTILFIYADRKAGEPAQKVYKEDSFYEYCMIGFLFPIHIPCIVVEKKMTTEESKNADVRE